MSPSLLPLHAVPCFLHPSLLGPMRMQGLERGPRRRQGATALHQARLFVPRDGPGRNSAARARARARLKPRLLQLICLPKNFLIAASCSAFHCLHVAHIMQVAVVVPS